MFEIIDLSQEIYSGMSVFTGRGRFRFIGLPLKIRGGTGSPVRAVAVFER
jgi:kynurenine formamidase